MISGDEIHKPLVHMFEYRGKRLIYDVNSGSLLEVDGLAWEYIHLKRAGMMPDMISKRLGKRYSYASICRVQEEINSLIEDKVLFSPLPAVSFERTGIGIKALCLFISQDCNLKCSYCFACPHQKGEDGYMSRKTAFGAVDLLLEQEGRYGEIDFFGGEPLLNFPLLKEVVYYARTAGRRRNKEFNFTLTTNALLLEKEVSQFLNEENISVILSLDGRPAVNDRMRRTIAGTGSYYHVLPRIHEFLTGRNYHNYYIRGTFTAYNVDFCHDVEHLLQEGFYYLSLEPVVVSGKSDLALHEDDLPRLEQEYDRLVDLCLQRRAEGRPFLFYHFDLDLEKGPCLYKRLAGCGAGSEYMAIAADGSIYPCHQFVGNASFRMGCFEDGFFKLDFQKEELLDTLAVRRKECRSCWARYLCGSGCAAASYVMTGNLKHNSILYCALQKIRLERALYLQAA